MRYVTAMMTVRGFFMAFAFLGLGLAVSTEFVHAEPAYCGDLYKAICGPNASVAEAREAKITRRMKEVEAIVRPEVLALAKEADLAPLEAGDFLPSAFRNVAIRFPHDLQNAKDVAATLFRRIEKILLSQGKIPDSERIRRRMSRAINEMPGLSKPIRSEMIRRLSETNVLLPSEYIRSYVGSRDELWPLLSRVSYDGAWNLELEAGGARAIIFFPGLLAAGGDLEFVLAHEFAHSLDFDIFPEAYGEMTSCMSRNYGAQFTEWTEISADFWGVDLIAKKLSRERATAEQTLDDLKQSHHILCEAQSEDPALSALQSRFFHPTGEFRIRQILGRNPVIRSLLGCAVSAAEPFCGIEDER